MSVTAKRGGGRRRAANKKEAGDAAQVMSLPEQAETEKSRAAARNGACLSPSEGLFGVDSGF